MKKIEEGRPLSFFSDNYSTYPIMTIHPLWKDFSYFPHQLDGIHWMLDKEYNGTHVPTRKGDGDGDAVLVRGGFQCDDMGLGKTIQIASVIVNHLRPSTLLFAPLAMLDTWISVLQRAGCIVYQVEKRVWTRVLSSKLYTPNRFLHGKRPAVYVSNYEKLYNNSSLFHSVEWDRVVLDEAHKIRNGDSDMARSARKIVAPLRWVVTGTPLVNSLKDIVALLAFIGVPYSPLWRWDTRYFAILPHLLLHRSLDSLRAVIQGAPPVPVVHEMVLPFTTKEEEEFYHGVQGTTQSMAKKYASDLLSSAQAFKLLLRLRQISIHPQIYIDAKRREDSSYQREDWPMSSTKLDAISRIIRSDDSSSTHKYIIFCQFHEEMAIIRKSLLSDGLVADDHILMYHGGLNQTERTDVLNLSKETCQRTVLLLQLQAGGVGLNLQEYDRILFVSPWWTSALIDQAIARAVRMGQTSVVHVYHLQLAAEMHNSLNIDKLVHAKAHQKRAMLARLFSLCSL